MSSSLAPLLSVNGLSLSYGRIRAVVDATFDLEPGQVLGLCGHNGAGKSSVVRTLSGQLSPQEGTILLDGREVVLTSVRDAQAKGIALVDQELSVIPALTVSENLALGEAELGVSGQLSNEEVLSRLAAVGLSDVSPDMYLEDLSIGRRQLVEIARAMGRNARLFILDEPTATLNSADIEHVFKAIRAVTARGCSVIFVSHRMDEVIELCDKIVLMRDGEIVANVPTSEVSGPKIVELMLGHVPARVAGDRRQSADREAGLVVKSLSTGVVQDLNLCASAGAVTALAGQVGSGTNDVLRALAGLDPESSGNVTIDGRNLALGNPRESLKAGFGYVSGDRKGEGLFLSRSNAENLVATRLSKIARNGVLTPGNLMRHAKKIAESVGVDVKRLGESASRLSGGNQQKVFIGRCLSRDDLSVVLLDEPTRGVDVGGRADIHKIIRAIAARGVIVLVAASDLDEVLDIADDIVVMRGGREVSRRMRKDTSTQLLLSDMIHLSEIQEA